MCCSDSDSLGNEKRWYCSLHENKWDRTHLEFILLTAEVGSLFLPEVVRLDDVGRVDAVAEVVLKHLQDGLHRGPARVAPHVNNHSKAQVSDILAEKKIIELDFCK